MEHNMYQDPFNPSTNYGYSTGVTEPLDNYNDNYNDNSYDGITFDQPNSMYSNGNNLGFDANGYGGRGSLAYPQQPLYGQRESQSLTAPARWNGHQSLSAFPSSNSGQSSTVPLGLDGSSHQNLDQEEGFFPTSSHGNGDQAPGSVEHGEALVEKRGARKQKTTPPGRSKVEQQDSDDEYDSDAEEVENKKKRKSYDQPRHLTRWNSGTDQLLLLALAYECKRRNIDLPWGAASLHLNAYAKPDGSKQHLVKVRKARIYYGLPVPPPFPKQDKEDPQYSDKEILNFATLVYVKPGTEEDANGTPGTMPPIYTPQPIAVGPHLPYYGRPGWPLSVDVADEMMTLLAIRGSQWSTTTPLTVEPPPGTQSIKKNARSAKAIKVEQEDEDDDDFTLKSVRKVSSTPTASQKKKAQLSTKGSASKGSPNKPLGVAKSKRSTPLKKMQSKASLEDTPIRAMTNGMAATGVNSSPVKTPSRKSAAATKKKAKVTKTAPPTPSNEEEMLAMPLLTPAKESEQPHKYGRRDEDVHVEPSETSGDTLLNAPPGFDMGRNLDLQNSGPRSDALGFHDQSMHSQGNRSFGYQSAMPGMPNQSMQRQSNFGNNMPRPTLPGNHHQSMQHQGGQIFDPQPMMVNGSGLSMPAQSNYAYNTHGQQMLHHGQHMAGMQQNHGQIWQTQNSMANNNMSQAMQPMQQMPMQQMYNLMPQPGTMQQQQQQQFVPASGFPGFGMDAGLMAREPMPGYVDEMSEYMTSTGHSMAESPRLSLGSGNTRPSGITPDVADSKPQQGDASMFGDLMLVDMNGELVDDDFNSDLTPNY